MIQTGERDRFGAKPLEDLGVTEIGVEHFDCHLALEGLVHRLVDGTHPPPAEAGDDAVLADRLANHVKLPRGHWQKIAGSSSGKVMQSSTPDRCATVSASPMPLLLSEDDVRSLLSMDDLIDAMQGALEQFSSGGAQQPLRTIMEVGAHHGLVGLMPAFIAGPEALGAKLVTVYHSNAAQNLPTHLATIILLEPGTGALQAILDGRYITEARTAAVSAASVRHLARDDARVLAVLGSGVQARSHIDAIQRVRDLTEVRVWSPTRAHVDDLIREMQPNVSARLIACASAADAARGADVIALVTAAADPVLRRQDVADGAHVCAVGSCRPTQREMDTALVRSARVFVDSRVGAMAEAGDLVIPMQEGAIDRSHVVGELGEVFGGRVAGRRDASEITLFKSLGMAVEDVAAARLTYERAVARGLGRGFVLA
ncbi:MAG TPA: ornithine cyclodeaminase family protein [Xanthobacteraceae bacterium]